MKTSLRSFASIRSSVAAGLVLPLSLFAAVIEGPLEFIAEGDFDGDGLADVLVLDKLSGAARVAFQSSGGAFSWHSFASGTENATSLAVGRIVATTRDSIATAAPSANRLQRIDPRDVLTATGILPVPVFPPGIGPSVAVAIDVGGLGNSALDDYFVITSQNPGFRRALLRNTGSDTSTLADTGIMQPATSGAAVEARLGQPQRLAMMSRLVSSGYDTFQLYDLSSGSVSLLGSLNVPLTNSPVRPQFVLQRFHSTNLYAQALFFRADDDGFLKFQLQENAGYQFVSSNRFVLGGGMQALRSIPHSTGARLLAFFGSSATNLTNATIYQFDGVVAPVALQSFDGQFSGALTTGSDNLLMLNAGADGRSTSFQAWLANGGGYVAGPSGELPRVHRFSGAANALLFDAEPFVSAAARPRQLQRHADWSTALQVTPAVIVTGQEFLGTSNGLGSASTRDFGAAPSGVVTGLVNQYTPAISVFSGRPALGAVNGEVRISPAGGRYGEAQRITLSITPILTWEIRYRVGPQLPWLTYSSPFLLSSNATVEFYARRLLENSSTPVGSARYTFADTSFEIDSDHDGVPDFVEQTRGLNPTAGADSDNDGFTDFEELARGTNPLSAASKPGSNSPVGAAFNRIVTPRSPNPVTGVPATPRTNVAIRAFSVGSAFLGQDFTRANIGSGTTNPAALLVGLAPEPGIRLIVETTPDHYDINVSPEPRVGREMIGLYARPDTNDLVVPFTPGNGTMAQEAASWIAVASNALASAGNPTVAGLLTPERAVVAALFERHAAMSLLARGTNWGTNATLFPFRAGDSSRRAITAAELLTIERYAGSNAPGHRSSAVFDFLDSRVRLSSSAAVLASFSRELWRVSAQQHNANEGAMALPYDELRRIIGGGSLGAVYSAFPSLTTNLPTAQTQAANLLAAIPARPRTNVTVTVYEGPAGGQPVLRHSVSGNLMTLWVTEGQPCAFPPNMTLLPGSQLAVFGHTDLPSAPDTQAIEVIALSLASIPAASATDANGNLLADSWEQLFLGTENGDPYGDADGDGYSNLQEMLMGSAPTDALALPPGPAYELSPPAVTLTPLGGEWRFIFTVPTALVGAFQFGLEASDDVTGPFVAVPTSAVVHLGNNQQELRIPATAAPMRYYRLTMALAPNFN